MHFRCSPRRKPVATLIAVLTLLTSAFSNAAPIPPVTAYSGTAAYKIGSGQDATPRPYTFRAITAGSETSKESLRHQRFASERYAALIDRASRNADLDPALVHAIIAVESGYNPAARSVKGAVGLMQVMPQTAARYGVADPAVSPAENLRAGTRYLSYLMTLFDNQIELALAAYNAGEYAVLRHGHRIPPYRETQNYVPAVLARYHRLLEQEAPPATVTTGIHYMPGTTFEPGAVDRLIYRLGDTTRSGRN